MQTSHRWKVCDAARRNMIIRRRYPDPFTGKVVDRSVYDDPNEAHPFGDMDPFSLRASAARSAAPVGHMNPQANLSGTSKLAENVRLSSGHSRTFVIRLPGSREDASARPRGKAF